MTETLAWPRQGLGRAGARQERAARLAGVNTGQPRRGVSPCPEDEGDHWRVLHAKETAGLPFGKITLEKGFGEGWRRQASQHGNCCKDPRCVRTLTGDTCPFYR